MILITSAILFVAPTASAVSYSEFSKRYQPSVALGQSGERTLLARETESLARGLDPDIAEPNRMTPEQSKEIYEERQEEQGDGDSTPGSNPGVSGESDDTHTQRGIDVDLAAPNELTPDQSNEIYEEGLYGPRQLLWWTLTVSVVIAGAIFLTIAVIRRRKK